MKIPYNYRKQDARNSTMILLEAIYMQRLLSTDFMEDQGNLFLADTDYNKKYRCIILAISKDACFLYEKLRMLSRMQGNKISSIESLMQQEAGSFQELLDKDYVGMTRESYYASDTCWELSDARQWQCLRLNSHFPYLEKPQYIFTKKKYPYI